ncbi:MAG TPA: alcohol dehydrogenase catalytic domain-containing protein [Woeseiaceae bacterium]|nr:alcohol dehydrogenase catalytic domain-containing protein [Woeseiaceae bacterium]
MKAMLLTKLGPLGRNSEPLALVDLPRPEPRDGEILLRVRACGVCHTELDEIEGRTPPPRLPVVPGHEVVGVVERRGAGATRHALGARVGVGWIHRSSGADDENLSDAFQATGRDTDGGYAEFMIADERYAYPIPQQFTDLEAAPLLCAGGVGYRALRLCGIANGDTLGLTGFGGSAHLVLQLARHLYPDSEVYVFARSAAARAFALELGAAWSGGTDARPPRAPHAIVDTTPAWKPVLAALRCLRPGGRLVINAIRKEDGDRRLMADIDYDAQLWREKELKTVANVTARDLREFLPLAAAAGIRANVQSYALGDANKALRELKAGNVRGAKVLHISS